MGVDHDDAIVVVKAALQLTVAGAAWRQTPSATGFSSNSSSRDVGASAA
jgi:hypothetical protein